MEESELPRWSHLRLVLSAFALVLALGLQAHVYAAASQHSRLNGVVTDRNGAPIAGAEVTLKSVSSTASQMTDGEGRFSFESTNSADGLVTVKAFGFRKVELAWRAQDPLPLELSLDPEPVAEQMTITAERILTRISETAASVVVLTSDQLASSAALTLDDALRQVPGFSLFRRSGSRTANPTSQGVSLRGVGASGASRAVVLADGIPLNDPFGGWVYWGRVPRESLGQIEVVRGGGSHLYGSDALGGVVNFITRDPADAAASVEASYGNQQTPSASLYAGGRFAQIGAQLSAETFHTDGYRIVEEEARGLVDTPAGTRHSSIEVTLERLFADANRFFLRGSLFGEARENGTPLQQNRTHIRQLSVGSELHSKRAGSVTARGYFGTQVFDQDFSSVAADRNSEALTRSQRVPAQQIGVTSQWSHDAGSRQTVIAGLDARVVRGASDELGFVGGQLSSAVGAGGRQRSIGIFAQDLMRLAPRLTAAVSVRVDHWINYDALSTSRPLAQPGPTAVTVFDDRTENAFSPRVSLLGRIADNASLFVSGYRAFRAPTLNELYRSFRVGNVLTQSNHELLAERLTGGEGGANVTAFDGRLGIRSTFFWSEVNRPVANVTISSSEALIIRRRENLGRTRSRGVELEATAQLRPTLVLSSGYQFVDATVLKFPANSTLEGLLIPQVPRHQMTFQLRYSSPSRVLVGLQGRIVGEQFDDDQNQFRLERFFTLDALASRPLTRSFELFAAAENVLNQRYTVGRTPVRTIGPPVLVRVGFRVRLGSR